MNASLVRIAAMVRRHLYLFRTSWPRIVSLMYYPTLQIILWALVTQYLAPTNAWLRDAPGFFVSAVILWELLLRSQLGVSLSFFEELYSRNLANLFVAPLRPWEYVVSLGILSIIRSAIGLTGAIVIVGLLFHFKIFEMGWHLVTLVIPLMFFGWAVGFAVSGMVLRWGLGAEELAWGLIFLIMPISGVYYPITTLPQWLHPIAYALPTAHVFDAMRAVVTKQAYPASALLWAWLLAAFWFIAGMVSYAHSIRQARRSGQLMQMGE